MKKNLIKSPKSNNKKMNNGLAPISAQENTISIRLIVLFIICFISTALGGTISTLMSVYLPFVIKDMKGNLSPDNLNYIGGYINSFFIFGWAFGGFGWGIISDWVGRKPVLLLSIASFGVFTFLTALMPSWWGIVFCRFMSGLGIGGLMVVSMTLISEVWPKKSMAIYTGILSISFPIGIFSAGLINYFVSSWRQSFFIGAIPVLFALIGYFFIFESDSWLKHKSLGLKNAETKTRLFSQANRESLFTGSLIYGTMLIGLWAIFAWLPTWIQSLIKSDSHTEGAFSMMFLGIGALFGGFLSGWVVNLIGLRKAMIASFSICSAVSIVLFKTNSIFTDVIYLEISLLAIFFGTSQGILSLYIPLLFNTGIRATATGFCYNAGRVFTGVAVLFIGVLVTTLGGYSNSLFIFSLVFLIGLVIVLAVKK